MVDGTRFSKEKATFIKGYKGQGILESLDRPLSEETEHIEK